MLKVATHSGTFHADDVFAFAILNIATGGQVELLRTRDSSLLEKAEVVFDVGGSLSPENGRYDHHMRDKPLRASGEPYSSAGLIWKSYGEAVVAQIFPDATREATLRIASRMDCGLIRDVDLMDNGAMNSTSGHISSLIEAFNPTFAENDREENAAFLQAAELAKDVLARVAARANAAILAESTVAMAAQASEDPRLLILDSRVPWEDAVFDLDLTELLYVIRPAGDAWTCNAVPPERGSFAQRRALPDAWGGLRDLALAALTAVEDATFCHSGLFVCGARSRQGALKLAHLALAGS